MNIAVVDRNSKSDTKPELSICPEPSYDNRLGPVLDAWKQEVIHNDTPVERRAVRTFVEIDEVREGPKGKILKVFVPRVIAVNGRRTALCKNADL